MSEFSRARIARVGDQVHFGEPWRGHLPAIRLHRDVVLEQMAGLGAAIDAPLPLGLLGPQSAIDLPGTDGQKLPLRRCAQPKPLSHPRHPDRQQRFRLSAATERQLLSISPRQIDRRLRAKKTQRKRRIYGRTKPGHLLKHHIPVKTDSWEVTSPGFTEVDLVSHSGNSGAGEFAHTLNVTDIHTTWTESRAVLGRGQATIEGACRRWRRPCRSVFSEWIRTMVRNSSTGICRLGASGKGSNSPADAPTRKTTMRTWSRRTGRMCASCWAGTATTRSQPSRPSTISTATNCACG